MALYDLVNGNGAGNVAEDPNAPATPDVPGEQDEELLKTLKEDLDRIKHQKEKPTGGMVGQALLNLCFLNDEPYVNYKNKTLSLEPEEANKLRLSFNLIAPRFNKLIGRLSAFNAPFKTSPSKKDPQALEDAEVCDALLTALDQKLDETSIMRDRLYWIAATGTCAELVTFVPNATIEPTQQFDEAGGLLYKFTPPGSPDPMILNEEQKSSLVEAQLAAEEAFEPYEEIELVGEVSSEVISPFNLFIDQGVKSIKDLAPDQWVHVARVKTTGWVEENFGVKPDPQDSISLIDSKINPQGESVGGIFLKDLIPMVQGSCDHNDPPMVLLVESYQPSSTKHPHGRYVCWIPDQRILHNAECPYEEIPLVDFHFSPVTLSFWTKAFITPLIAPQRFINKRMNQLGEQANAAIYSAILLGPTMNATDIPTDYPGVINNGWDSEKGTPNLGRLPPPEIPTWFLQSIELAVKMFNDAAGGADLMEDNKFPGQLRGPLAVPMLQEILDTQWGPLFNHLGERIARVKQMRLNRVKQFYPPERTMHYTSRDQRDEVLTFHTEAILRSGTNYNVSVERGSLLPELRSLREARVKERLSGPLAILYMDERTGRLDKSKIAADLQFGDVGREGREAKYRKLQLEIIALLWKAQPVPPVQPFYDHKAMLDELEDAMATTEFLRSSPQVQALFAERWQQHAFYLQQEAMMQQQAMQSGMIQNAVAQATQQAAAMAAADAVNSTHEQMKAQAGQPTEQYVASAQAKTGGQNPQQGKPQAKRKFTYEEHD